MAVDLATPVSTDNDGTVAAPSSTVTTTGGYILVFITRATSTTGGTLSDNSGGAISGYTQIGSTLTSSSDGQLTQLYITSNKPAAGTYTITFTATGSSPFWTQVVAVEVTGAASSGVVVANDQQLQTAPTTGTDAVDSSAGTPPTPTGYPCLVVGFTTQFQGSAIPTAGTGFTSVWTGFAFETSTIGARIEKLRITSGTALATFTTTTNIDTMTFMVALLEAPTNPTLLTFTPQDNALGVPLSPTFNLAFDMSVVANTGNITVKRASDNATIETIAITNTGQVTFSGSNCTFTLSSPLANSTEYYVLIDSTAIQSSGGNPWGGIASSTTWSFTTLDVDQPSEIPMLRDRVKETTTTTGTGNITLAGAATGFESFNTAFGVGPYFFYGISSSGGSEWEVGIGHLSGTTTLVRDRVLESSNADALVSFSSGTKDVFCTLPGAPARATFSMSMIDASTYLR